MSLELRRLDVNEAERSAIIGYWRMGVSEDVIALLVGCTEFAVLKAIHDYKRFVICREW